MTRLRASKGLFLVETELMAIGVNLRKQNYLENQKLLHSNFIAVRKIPSRREGNDPEIQLIRKKKVTCFRK